MRPRSLSAPFIDNPAGCAPSGSSLPPPRDDVVQLILLGRVQLSGPVADPLAMQPDDQHALFLVVGLVVAGPLVAGREVRGDLR